MTSERPVVEFDHHAHDFPANETYRSLREHCPVVWTETYGGYWILSRYKDVANAARNDATFSSARDADGHGGIVIPEWTTSTSIPLELDPAEQMPYRKMLNQLFSPAVVEDLKPLIADLTTTTIDAFIERGECDFINELTGPVPALVTVHLLGLPAGYAQRFARAVHDVFGSAPLTDRAERGVDGMAWISERILEQVKLRRDDPGDDVISFLCTQRIEGEPLSDEVVMSIAKLIVGGGMDTTTSLTGQTLVWLSEHPDTRQRLIDEPELLVPATDEFLRVFAPSQSMARTVTESVELGGCTLAPGDRVLLPWVAANFDESVFDRPDEVILDRERNRHLSFGIGFHRCVGAHLAKAMFQEMMTQVLRRLPDYRVLADQLVPYASHGNQTGWDVVPAEFTPGPRLATAAA
ncbi:MAG: cytochrome P450 [Acidimicrobiales bacterium]